MEGLKKIIKERRSYYNLSDKSPVSDKEIKELIDFAVLNVPSAFNSQTTRVVLLLNEHHTKLWDIVKDVLLKITGPDKFGPTKEKIETSFQSGYGTILFYEDQSIIRGLQEQFSSYSEKFPGWSEHTSAMHQYAIWMLLEDAGFGATVQHYNPVIDAEVAKTWNINPDWELKCQMPFGIPTAKPGEKEFGPLEKRVLIFE
ncbi:MAG: nitroreductase family protein [Tannerella sp.]|jgi:predicted oxidoreductase (fatty acid repression mutant protein)|nr:nitroreductase family protein [Tannerella sp.]